VIIVSASSKTALGLAQGIKESNPNGYPLVLGITSARNLSFVESTGLYDQTCTYDNMTDVLGSIKSAVVVDMSGNRHVVEAIHNQLDCRLMYSMAIGFSHHSAGQPASNSPMKGPPQQLFFAPSEVTRRSKQWGVEGYHNRAKGALTAFVVRSREWMDVERLRGPVAVEAAWKQVYEGSIAPKKGLICSMFDEGSTE
jgi:hypothetical protein